MALALINAKIITPFRIIREGTLLIEDNNISELGYREDVAVPESSEIIDCRGRSVCPGFVDLLVHGALGYGFSDGTHDDFKTISDYFLKKNSMIFNQTGYYHLNFPA